MFNNDLISLNNYSLIISQNSKSKIGLDSPKGSNKHVQLVKQIKDSTVSNTTANPFLEAM